MSICSTASETVVPSLAIVLTNGYKLQTTTLKQNFQFNIKELVIILLVVCASYCPLWPFMPILYDM